jgi:hypothetical protein
LHGLHRQVPDVLRPRPLLELLAGGEVNDHASCSALLDRSLAELQERLERQRTLVRALAQGLDGAPASPGCPLIHCASSARLRHALIEAVAVLEETRRSFKSRQLESLRKRLMTLLAEP